MTVKMRCDRGCDGRVGGAGAGWGVARTLRAAAYPPIGDQLDDLFRQGAFSPEMAATLQAVKARFPK